MLHKALVLLDSIFSFIDITFDFFAFILEVSLSQFQDMCTSLQRRLIQSIIRANNLIVILQLTK
jgi:hypothetical protein